MQNTTVARSRFGALVAGRAHRTPPAKTWERRTGFIACAWMTVFAGFHAYWALGGTLGLPPGQSLVDNKPLFIIDLIAIPMNLVGAIGALALVQNWGLAFPRWFVLGGGWACAVLMICHSAPSMVDLAVFLIGQRDKPLTGNERFSVLLYEPYWMLGGILFTFLARGFQRRTRRSYAAAHAEAV
ncbi:DUF3995 domain-containing protein [Streptomyces sp. NBC_01618]|uniref:DUF3995 domain-containing protein n=1 Tax=Streptomyces sp. NBC_01618 TaxID=2975900 RepID=UPI003863FC17|nr:DUF3995 domain-containing protein [Streptomyces sp. NBC_01618]